MHIKRTVIIITLLGVLVISGIAQLSAQDQPEQEGILQAMADALNAGDVETALSYFGDNAVFVSMYGEPEGALNGKEEIRALFDDLAAGNFQIEVNVVQSFDDGTLLISDTETRGDPIAAMGFESFHAYEAYVVRGEKIQVVTWVLSNESLAGVMEAMASSSE